MPTAKTPSLKATKQAAKKPSAAKVLKLDTTTGALKPVPTKKPAAKSAITAAAASLGIEEMLGKPAPEKAPKGGPRKAGATTPGLVAKEAAKYASQKEAVAAAIAAGRGRTAVFAVNGSFLLGSRRRGLLKGWSYLGRAAALAGKCAAT